MKKILMVFITFALLFVVACSNEKAQATPKHLNDLVTYFKNKGYKLDGKTDKYYTMIGAINGFGININGHSVELYEFDPNQKNPILDTVKESEELNGAKAEVNGIFLLVEHDNGSEMDDIVKTFEKA